ncbi:MAG TPA: hypothetical protein VHC94_15115 [Nitrobacter sp.]|nr:hypothetical protein [Nitrobacter sp.]
MLTFIRLPARLKAMLFAASVGLARGDMLPIVVISSLFSAARRGFGAKRGDRISVGPARVPRADQPFKNESLHKTA